MVENWYYILLLIILKATICSSTMLEFLACGMDSAVNTNEGTAPARRYPWLGILYHTFDRNDGDRATTMAVMVRRNYALVPSFDITNIPRSTLRTNTRVVFGMDWITDDVGLRVDSYVLHPEYKANTLNTMALVKFEESFGGYSWPVCPPVSGNLRNDTLYSVIVGDVKAMTKTVRKMAVISNSKCLDFYRKNKLSYRRMRPTMMVCAAAVSEHAACVWEGGSALVSRDPWGRWRLVGFGVRGPGCAAPAQYADVYRYLPWMERTMASEEYITVRRTAPNQLFLRQGQQQEEEDTWVTAQEKVTGNTFKEFNQMGNCFDTSIETTDLYRENSVIQCDAMRAVKGRYRLMITQIVNVVCVSVTTEGVHGASHPFLWIEHMCDRDVYSCHIYRNTTSSVDIAFLFSFKMTLKILFVGQQVPKEQYDPMVLLLPPEKSREADLEFKRQRERLLATPPPPPPAAGGGGAGGDGAGGTGATGGSTLSTDQTEEPKKGTGTRK